MNIEKLGFNDWFQEQVDRSRLDDYQLARVIAVDKNSYVINSGPGEVAAEITGKMMFTADSPLDYPTVGDWVYAQYFDEGSFAIIHEILPRRSYLKRKTAGKKIEFQLIAANIDTAFIVQSLDSNYNPRRLERYLVMVKEGHIQPVVLLSKSDLLSPTELDEKKNELLELMPDVQIVTFSSLNREGLQSVKDLLGAGQTFCLLGSSGVGKTTLLNSLLDSDHLKTQSVREKDSKGKHTTTRRQLIHLADGGMVIDTPGMRELGNISTESGLSEVFDEILALATECRYSDCSHTQEDGCAILDALADGTLSEDRYQNYVKMEKESTFNEMSYLEKRHKDKEFGKMIKSVLKHHPKKRS